MTTEHDRAVLNSIFNPLLPVGEAAFEQDVELKGMKSNVVVKREF